MVSHAKTATIGTLVAALILSSAAGPALAQQKAAAFSDEAVVEAIKKGKEYLWSTYQANDGHWVEVGKEGKNDGSGEEPNYGGRTALVVYALMTSGESYQEPRLKKAINWLSKVETQGTYTLGLRCQIWAMLPKEIGRAMLEKDVKRLVTSINQSPPGKPLPLDAKPLGMYRYACPGAAATDGGDHSNTQYGILGAWAGVRVNSELVKPEYWNLVYRHWVMNQNPDGGWGYGVGGSQTTPTMTAAGLASIYVAYDNLYNDQFIKCGLNPEDPAIKKALEWMDQNFNVRSDPPHYFLYGIERVGLASGYKYFGKKDWYKLGAEYLLSSQAGEGKWAGGGLEGGDDGATAFSLLFLCRGRNAIVFNRLEYTGDWNNRPRAVANLTRWMSSEYEREVNWQIINLTVPVAEWHDAPVLLITGNKKPTFAAADIDKLRTFVQQGGTILSVAECDGKAFDLGMREAYKQMFPEYELATLPGDHPLFNAHFPIKNTANMQGMSNGVRLLALHSTTDMVLSWQTNATVTTENFKMASNIFNYITDRRSAIRSRGTSLWPEDTAGAPATQIKVARVKYKGNCDPEPLAWERFRLLMAQKAKVGIQVAPVAAGELNAADTPFAALTGTTAVEFTAQEKEALKKFVNDGGTLIVDAAGGSDKFGAAAEKLMNELFGADCLARLPATAPLFTQSGREIKAVKWRRAAKERILDARTARIDAVTVNNRVGVYFSREDLTAGLVGVPAYSCIGVEPDSAYELVRNMVLGGSGGAASQPTTSP